MHYPVFKCQPTVESSYTNRWWVDVRRMFRLLCASITADMFLFGVTKFVRVVRDFWFGPELSISMETCFYVCWSILLLHSWFDRNKFGVKM